MTKGSKNYFAMSAALIISAAILLCAGCEKSPEAESEQAGFEIEKAYDRGPLSVWVRVSKKEITIAQTLELELEAAIEQGYEVSMPKIDKAIEQFALADWDRADERLDETGRMVKKCSYRLEPFLSGPYQIGGLKFEFYDVNSPDENKYELLTEAVDVEVTSLMGEGRAELEIADIEDVIEIPRIIHWKIILAAAGGCVAAAAIASTWIYFNRRRQKQLIRIFRPAHEIAYDLLRILTAEDLISAGRVKEFYERISNILRHYIEHRFALRAPERTTEEFLFDLSRTDVLAAGDKDDLKEFLTHCDLVKFARHDPTAEQIQRTFNLVKKFIEKTISDEKKVDVTDMQESGERTAKEVA